eukprot:TRINITY_DN2304_c0_g1_i2.p1 TRINITY_DN2304_c0_g1~~TRINITY_DN2304_c0_g1_i2.p1  ORF type:complete len:175 (+),score=55.66 TRINITY_DN2304_c0_g1_i2:118-642(+)
MIRRPPRSTLSSSSAASDVYKRQVSTQSTGNNSWMDVWRTHQAVQGPMLRIHAIEPTAISISRKDSLSPTTPRPAGLDVTMIKSQHGASYQLIGSPITSPVELSFPIVTAACESPQQDQQPDINVATIPARHSPPQIGSPQQDLSLIHISEPTRLLSISYAVFCLKKKKKKKEK